MNLCDLTKPSSQCMADGGKALCGDVLTSLEHPSTMATREIGTAVFNNGERQSCSSVVRVAHFLEFRSREAHICLDDMALRMKGGQQVIEKVVRPTLEAGAMKTKSCNVP